jgi:hypothetical protein|tara:strand:- start:650 stop:1264 length:615 start_codon:yes stop_codon:yes gene_type:complete
MAVVSNGTTIIDAGALGSGAATGKTILIKTLTASNSANLSFVHGSSSVVFNNTYDKYVFKFINIHPATDGAKFQVNFRDGGTAYDATKTTTLFQAYKQEDGGGQALTYRTPDDLAQSTASQMLSADCDNDNDSNLGGELTIFNPSSTVFQKQFMSTTNSNYNSAMSINVFVGGYVNVTAAVDGVQFTMSSGNFDGIIKLYGIGG